MVAARGTRDPLRVSSGTVSSQVLVEQFVEATGRQSQGLGGSARGKLLGAELLQDMSDQGRSEPMSQLRMTFFIPRF
jgi:hypothetical protein